MTDKPNRLPFSYKLAGTSNITKQPAMGILFKSNKKEYSSMSKFYYLFLLLCMACNSRDVSIEYYYNGQEKLVSEVVNGKLDGKSTEYYEDGTVKSVGFYKEGLTHGRFESYYEDGTIKFTGEGINGKNHGKATSYYRNGNPELVNHYVNGMSDGLFIKYYENGVIKGEGTMKNGKPFGKVTAYDSLGNLISECLYDENGKRQDCTFYSES
jgi:antitoxin component YwqK of YwqJK toxin-antitoxin module